MRSLLAATAVLLVAATAASAAGPKWNQLSPQYSFDEYCAHHGKFYEEGSVEYGRRKLNFERELRSVLEHNSRVGASYKRGINRFSDMTSEEKRNGLMFNKLAKSARPESMPAHDAKPKTQTPLLNDIKRSIDYRRNDPPVLTAIKDQGFCGSCWSHGTTEAIETYTAFATGHLHVLSQQQLVSCTPMHPMNYTVDNQTIVDKMEGCDGYMPNLALDYLVKNQKGEMFTEWMFPYTSYYIMEGTAKANYSKCLSPEKRVRNSFTNVTGHTMLPANDQNAILNHLSTSGPLITIMYCPESFMSYEHGVFHSNECVGYGGMQPSHIVLIVGYGHDDDLNMDYYIIRNSWNSDWGENGYFRVLRTAPEICGHMPLPNKDKTAFVNQTACGTCGVEAFTLFPEIGQTIDFYKYNN